MSIKLSCANTQVNIPLNKVNFPAGEAFHRLPDNIIDILNKNGFNVDIEFNYENNGEFVELAMLVDSLRRNVKLLSGYIGIHLFMLYIPFARQDRVCNFGEPLSVAVVADLVNSMSFDSVTVLDPHSDVSTALFNDVIAIEQHEAVTEFIGEFDLDKTVLVSPDAGALKKIFKVAAECGFKHILMASKRRDLATGAITDTILEIPEQYQTGFNFLVVDDICDGGRTFIELGKVIKHQVDAASQLQLFVSHGLFTKGYDELKKYFNKIVTANLMAKSDGDGFVVHENKA